MNFKKTALCFAAALSFLQSNSQNEHWAVPPNNYNMSGTTPVVTPISGATSTSSDPTNGAYDASGNLLFYVKGLQVYSATSTSLGQLPTPGTGGTGGPEIEIVPIPGQENCKKFYVIYTCGSSICYAIVDCSSGSPSCTPGFNSHYSLPNTYDLLGTGYWEIQGLAVSKLTTTNTRYLFSVATNDPTNPDDGGIYRFTISATGISAGTIIAGNRSLKYTPTYIDGYFQWSSTNQLCNQLSLSADQTRLGWGGGIVNSYTPSADQNVYEVMLSGYSYVANSFKTYYLTSGLSPNNIDHFVGGVNYDNSNRMYASTSSGIYVLSSYGGTFSKITGSSAYTYIASQLEYVPASNLIIGVAPTTTTSTTGKFFSINSSLGVANYLSGNTVNSIFYNGVGEAFTLPDQIDGEVLTYNSFTPSISIPRTTVCVGNPIVVTGNNVVTGSATPDYYYWEIDQCTDASGSNPTLVWSSSYAASPGNPFTIPGSNTLACGKYYKVTYSVKSTAQCVAQASTSIMVYVGCADNLVVTGNNTICAGGSDTLHSNYIYSSNTHIDWNLGTSHSISQNVVVTPSVTSTYTLTGTYVPDGCVTSTVVTVVVAQNNPDFTYVTNYASPNNYFTVSATPVVSNGYSVSGFGDLWVVEQIDPSTGATIPNTNTSTGTQPNPTCWWSYYPNANVFGGFDGTKSSGINNVNCGPPVSPLNGAFLNGATYRITRGTWNSICPWAQISHTITVSGHRPVSGNPNTNLDESTIDYSYLRYQQASTGIDNLSNDNSSLVNIYPNPNNGDFTIETGVTTSQLVEVYDLTGRIVKSQTINGKATINASDLVSGVYNVKITGNNSIVNKRMVITK